MSFQHDLNTYTTVPTRSPAGTLGLSRALLSAASPANDPLVLARLGALYDSAVALQVAWTDANRELEQETRPRVYDNALDRAWRGFRDRLRSWVDIEDELHGPRAAELGAKLLPNGLEFLKLPFAEQWSHSEMLLGMIDTDGLGPELEQIVGPRIMDNLRKRHAAYGEILGITAKKPPAPEPARVAEAIAQCRAAIVGYTGLVAMLAHQADDEAIAAAEAQLEPMLRFRIPRTVVAAEEAEASIQPLPDPPGSPEPQLSPEP